MVCYGGVTGLFVVVVVTCLLKGWEGSGIIWPIFHHCWSSPFMKEEEGGTFLPLIEKQSWGLVVATDIVSGRN